MATKLYLPYAPEAPADVNPSFDGSWTQTTNADRARSSTTKQQTSTITKTQAGVNGTTLQRQFVSIPMIAQTVASGTVKGTIRCAESAANDNILQVAMSIRICSRTGTITQTWLSLSEYGPSNEWATVATGLTNRRIADGDSIGAITVDAGDRIVIEIGYFVSSGTTISGDMNFGDNNVGADLGDDETGTTQSNPFVEFSSAIIFESVIGTGSPVTFNNYQFPDVKDGMSVTEKIR